MKNQILWAGIVATAMFAGCSKSGEETPAGKINEEGYIMAAATSGVQGSVQSKAAYTDPDADGLTAQVLATKTTGDYSTVYANGEMTFNAGTAESDAVAYKTGTGSLFVTGGSSKLPADKSSVFLCALYPSNSGGSTPALFWTVDASGTTASATFTGFNDIMASAESETAKEGGTAGTLPKFASFTFEHLLMRLDISVKAEDQATADLWGKVTKIVLDKFKGGAVPNKVAVTLKDGEALPAAFTGTASAWPTYIFGDAADNEFDNQSLTLTNAKQDAATVMTAPVAAAANNELVFKVTTNTGANGATDVVTDVKVTLPNEATQGKAYAVNLIFKAKEIKAVATVTAWGTGATVPDADVL